MKSKGKSGYWFFHLHPLLFVLSPVLALYSLNWGEVTPAELVRPALVLLLVSVALGAVLYSLLQKDIARISLLISVFLFFFFLYEQWGQLFETIRDFVLEEYTFYVPKFREETIHPQVAVTIAASLWVALTALWLWGWSRVRRDLSGTLWLAGIALIAPSLGRIITKEIAHTRVATIATRNQVALRNATRETVTMAAPDLYVVVQDAYARQDVLKTVYGLDNEPFLKALEERGFIVARYSRANYIRTPLAIASALNLDYLPTYIDGGDLSQMQPMIDQNRIAAMLTRRGDKFISIPTGFRPTATPSADLILDERKGMGIYLAAYPLPFEQLLVQKTILTVIPQNDDYNFTVHRQRLLSAFVHLGDAAALPYPKFVFAHILAPHPPFVFDAQGRPTHRDKQVAFTLGDGVDYKGARSLYRVGYPAQVQFVNHEVLAALDQMQKRSHRPYIIVLMGDHGSRYNTLQDSLEHTNLHEVFSNLFAVYCSPSVGTEAGRSALRKRLSGVVTPVTGLRQVMNTGFGMALPDLPDRSFYSTKQKPCDFQEVTDHLVAPVVLP